MTIGAILLHIMLFNNVSAPVRHLHRIYDEYTEALAYSEGFFAMIETDDSPAEGGVIPETVHGTFSFRHVDFVYPNGKQALKNVSFEFPAPVGPRRWWDSRALARAVP